MNVVRVCGLVGGLAITALWLVHLRGEQVRCAAHSAAMEAEWIHLRREIWTIQTRAARLRSPQRLHERISALRTDLIEPGAVFEDPRQPAVASRRQ